MTAVGIGIFRRKSSRAPLLPVTQGDIREKSQNSMLKCTTIATFWQEFLQEKVQSSKCGRKLAQQGFQPHVLEI